MYSSITRDLTLPMIDNPKQVATLIAKMETALPLPAIITPRLAAMLREQSPGASIPRACQVTWVSNAGDEGGIVYKLSAGEDGDDRPTVFTSIKHLDFDPRLPLAREIGAYQKHRVNMLRRQAGNVPRATSRGGYR